MRRIEPLHENRSAMSRIVLPFVVIAVAAGIGAVLLKTPQQVSKSPPQHISAVVGVVELRPQSERVFVEAFGTVVAAREVRIQPEVVQVLHRRAG